MRFEPDPAIPPLYLEALERLVNQKPPQLFWHPTFGWVDELDWATQSAYDCLIFEQGYNLGLGFE